MTDGFKVAKPRSGIKQNLIGKRSGKLTVIKQSGRDKHKRVLWECECNCGNKTLVTTHYFNCGKKTSCGCTRKALGKENRGWTGYENISGSFWATIKSGASKRCLDFKITIQEAWEIYLNQEKKCALTGISIEFALSQRKNGDRTKATASLDRIDSTKGYLLANIQWVHKDVNMMKNKFNQDYFIETCSLIFRRNCESKNKKTA